MIVTGVFDADADVLDEFGYEERPLDRIQPNDEFNSVTVILVICLLHKRSLFRSTS